MTHNSVVLIELYSSNDGIQSHHTAVCFVSARRFVFAMRRAGPQIDRRRGGGEASVATNTAFRTSTGRGHSCDEEKTVLSQHSFFFLLGWRQGRSSNDIEGKIELRREKAAS